MPKIILLVVRIIISEDAWRVYCVAHKQSCSIIAIQYGCKNVSNFKVNEIEERTVS